MIFSELNKSTLRKENNMFEIILTAAFGAVLHFVNRPADRHDGSGINNY